MKKRLSRGGFASEKRQEAAFRMSGDGGFGTGLEGVPENDGDADKADGEADVGKIVVVFLDFCIELILRHHFAEPVAESAEDDVPRKGAEACEDDEFAYVHACEAGGDGNELTHGGDEASDEGGDGAVSVEVFLGVAHLGFVDEAGVTEAAVGEFIDYRTAYPHGKIVVDESADDCADGSDAYDSEDVDIAFGTCKVGCGGDDDFRGEGDEGTLNNHKTEYEKIDCGRTGNEEVCHDSCGIKNCKKR